MGLDMLRLVAWYDGPALLSQFLPPLLDFSLAKIETRHTF